MNLNRYKIRFSDGWVEVREFRLLDAVRKAHIMATERGTEIECVELVGKVKVEAEAKL